jgi:uncharacterized protein YigA (DUF484 family)
VTNGKDLRERVADLEAQLLGMSEVARENERLHLNILRILNIVTEYVIESNDYGGLDCNDLVSRLEAEGFGLPEGEEG